MGLAETNVGGTAPGSAVAELGGAPTINPDAPVGAGIPTATGSAAAIVSGSEPPANADPAELADLADLADVADPEDWRLFPSDAAPTALTPITAHSPSTTAARRGGSDSPTRATIRPPTWRTCSFHEGTDWGRARRGGGASATRGPPPALSPAAARRGPKSIVASPCVTADIATPQASRARWPDARLACQRQRRAWDELHHRGSGATQPSDGVRQNVVAHAPTRHSQPCLPNHRRFQIPRPPPVDGRKPSPVNSPDRQRPTTTAGRRRS